MTAKTQARLKAQAKILKALAHPTRLLLIEELARQTKCVCELREVTELDMSTVSKHLSVLRNAGIGTGSKAGIAGLPFPENPLRAEFLPVRGIRSKMLEIGSRI